MKAISLWQPWASAIAIGAKHYETRSWGTKYRGDLLICSAKRKELDQKSSWLYLRDKHSLGIQSFESLPFGMAVAVCKLADCIFMTENFIDSQSEIERDFGCWEEGRFAWKLEQIQPIKPFALRGQQGLFDYEGDIQKSELSTAHGFTPESSIRDNYTLIEQSDCCNLINGFLPQQWGEKTDRWNPKHFGETPRVAEENGQLSIFFDTSHEPPEPDDYPDLESYEQAWEQWEASCNS